MKKIAFFSKNLEIGGMEKALLNLLNSLKDKYEIWLFLEEKKGVLLNELNNSVIIEEYALSKFKIPLFRKIHNFIKRCFFYIKFHNKFDFSCSYATYSIICSKLALISSKNSSLYVHSNYAMMYKNNENDLIRFFNSLNIHKFKNILFVSKESKNELVKVINDIDKKSYVINNIINGNEVIMKSKEKCNVFNKNNINLLFIGRLDNSSKNFDLLLSTFKEIHNLDGKYKLTILGSGNAKNYILNLINGYKLENDVTIFPFDINPYNYMNNADAVILTSKYEGFPVIYLESLILNKKVFTTINVDDGYVNTKNYFFTLSNNPIKNALIIKDNINKNINYDFNFNKYNNYNLNKLLKKIEEGNDE